eukprot:2297733-Ditylum_brightwellii.AAC.1
MQVEESGERHCGTVKHAKLKFSPKLGIYYLRAMGSTIFTAPTLLDSVLTHEKQSELLGQIYNMEEYK